MNGFNFKLPVKENIVEPKILDYVVPVYPDSNNLNTIFSENIKLPIKYKNNKQVEIVEGKTICDIINDGDINYQILIGNEWVDKSEINFSEIV